MHELPYNICFLMISLVLGFFLSVLAFMHISRFIINSIQG